MKLPHPFYRFPLLFDAQRLQEELQQVAPTEWISHPQRYQGNDALILISVLGQDNHKTNGAMRPTKRLQKLPYLQQVIEYFNTVIGRTRLMRLAPRTKVHCTAILNITGDIIYEFMFLFKQIRMSYLPAENTPFI